MQESDSIVAPATPSGESALAVVRTSGHLAVALAARCHHDTPPPPRVVWHGDYVTNDGVVLDDVVYTFFAAPKSFTGEDSLEISCHGNPLIVSSIIADLAGRGFRLAEPGEFTKRAFLNGRLDLTEAEAVMDLIRARSDRALEAARRQLRGALRQRVDGQIARLLDLCAAVEAHVDFPEEDLPVADRHTWTMAVSTLTGEVRALAATRKVGDRVRQGLKVVLIGEPNAGKSTLLNRLVGYDRAIVSPEPGTTRDFIEEPLLLAGHHIRLFDTAGLREATGGVERAGVERTFARIQEADLVVIVADGSAPAPQFSEKVATLLRDTCVLVVANKSDLGDRHWDRLPCGSTPPIAVSALRDFGIPDVRTALAKAVNDLTGNAGTADGLVVNARHEQSLNKAAHCLDQATAELKSTFRPELVAEDLRASIEAMGEIVGKIDHEAVLDRLFATFCIGK